MNKTIVAVVVIIVCLVVSAWFIFRNPITTKPEVEQVKKYGPKIHVLCTDKSCGYSAEDFRAHSYDTDWPKECPKCKNKTLYRCVICPQCVKYTPKIIETAGDHTFYTCRNCGAKMEIVTGGEEALLKKTMPARGGGR
jgi:hypothetical protein